MKGDTSRALDPTQKAKVKQKGTVWLTLLWIPPRGEFMKPKFSKHLSPKIYLDKLLPPTRTTTTLSLSPF